MTKQQKVWFWVGIVLAALPEILWSPVGNFVYSLMAPTINGSVQILRNNFLVGNGFEKWFSCVLFLQFLGVFFIFISQLISYRTSKNKTVWGTKTFLCLLVLIVMLYVFGFSVTLSHFGF